jgi:hypothetical protein
MRYKIILTSEQNTELKEIIENWNAKFQSGNWNSKFSGNVIPGHGGVFLLNRNEQILSVELIRHEVFHNVSWDGLFILTINKGAPFFSQATYHNQMGGDLLNTNSTISVAKGDNRYELLMNWMAPKIREQKLDEIGL